MLKYKRKDWSRWKWYLNFIYMKDRNIVHSDDWATPKDFYDELNKEFNFDFDPCPFQNDIEVFNGLTANWGKVNFVNPPYSRKLKEQFVLKGLEEAAK